MQRQIKFRAWNTEEKIMVDLQKITPLALDPNMNTQLSLKGGSGLFLPFLPDMTLMQYTGLKDKNGVGIYEGDLLQEEGSKTYSVKFSEEGYWFADPINCEGDWFHLYDFDWNVIGNIYEHPNLLEE